MRTLLRIRSTIFSIQQVCCVVPDPNHHFLPFFPFSHNSWETTLRSRSSTRFRVAVLVRSHSLPSGNRCGFQSTRRGCQRPNETRLVWIRHSGVRICFDLPGRKKIGFNFGIICLFIETRHQRNSDSNGNHRLKMNWRILKSANNSLAFHTPDTRWLSGTNTCRRWNDWLAVKKTSLIPPTDRHSTVDSAEV